MNYSKPMKINCKRFFTFWIITLVIAAVISACITSLIMKPKAVETGKYFFSKEVQDTEPTNTPAVEVPIMESLGEYRITAFCPCEKCCGVWAKKRTNGIVNGAYGIELKPEVSIAAPFPVGTKLYIDGIGEYVVQDKIASWVIKKYNNKVIDIYFKTHEDAQAFGLQHKEVFIMKGGKEND